MVLPDMHKCRVEVDESYLLGKTYISVYRYY